MPTRRLELVPIDELLLAIKLKDGHEHVIVFDLESEARLALATGAQLMAGGPPESTP